MGPAVAAGDVSGAGRLCSSAAGQGRGPLHSGGAAPPAPGATAHQPPAAAAAAYLREPLRAPAFQGSLKDW